MSMNQPTPEDILRAAYWGMDPRIDAEVAEDLGIPSSPGALQSHLQSAAEVKGRTENTPEAAAHLAEYICGECCYPVPCDHIGVDRDGKRYTIG